MSTLVAYIAIFIGAGIFAIAGGIPLNPLQILWLNMVIDIPIAIALGFDEPDPGPDGPCSAPGGSSGPLGVELGAAVRPGVRDDGGHVRSRTRSASPTTTRRVASTMLLTTLSLFHLAAGLPRPRAGEHDLRSEAVPGADAAAPVRVSPGGDRRCHGDRIPAAHVQDGRPEPRAVVDLPRHRASSLVVVEELIKVFIRRRTRADVPTMVAATAETPCGPGRGLTKKGIEDGIQPPEPELREGARLHARRAQVPAEAVRRSSRRAKYGGYEQQRLAGKNIALIFEKTSTRTRTAFEVAAHDQGAHVTYLEPTGSQIGHKESMKDTARVLGRTFDGIEYRGFAQETVEILAEYAGVPVWNGLTNEFHPTQILADVLTMTEHSDKHLGEIAYYLPGRRAEQHGELADGRRVQVRDGRPAVRARAPVAGGGAGQDGPRDRGGDRRPAHAHRRRRRGREGRRLPLHGRLGLDGGGPRACGRSGSSS